MAKNKLMAITETARAAGAQLTAWGAVEAHAKRILDATKEAEVNGDFAEIHFSGNHVQGVIKAGNVVLKIDR